MRWAVLHLLNGDALRFAFARADMAGDLAVCGDMLSEGPVPGGLGRDADWEQRARELERRYDIPSADYLAQSQRLRGALADAAKQDEVTLWFEQDLFCLVNLAFCLQAMAASAPPRLSLVFPSPPLGAKQGPSLRKLWEKRTDARPMLDPARAFWRAYAGPDPPALLALPPGLPWQAEGVAAHLARFPAPGTGLNAAEAATLRVLQREGPLQFGELFQRVSDEPGVRDLGAGDVGLAALLRDLAAGPKPLALLENAADRRLDMAQVLSWEAAVEPLGEAALRGEVDAVRERGLDRWVGGVHLEGRTAWRWDARTSRLA